MPCSSRVGGFRIPPVHGKLGLTASNHEPADGMISHESTHFTSEFLQRCHALTHIGISVIDHPHFAIEACRRFGVRIVNSPTCSLFTLPLRCALWSIIQTS